MSKPKQPGSYRVGYGKPPKDSQFTKGTSGNPSGRPKKTLNFDQELIKEANSHMFVTENGKRKRMSKHKVFIKQLMKQAMTGNAQASRIYLALLRSASENIPSMKGNNWVDLNAVDVSTLTDDELTAIIIAGETENLHKDAKE